MNPHEIRAFVLRWLNAVSTGNSDEFSSLVSLEVLNVNTGTKTAAHAFEARARAVREAFSDLRPELDDLLIEGDRIAWRWQISGVHRAPFLGQPASGRRVTLRRRQLSAPQQRTSERALHAARYAANTD